MYKNRKISKYVFLFKIYMDKLLNNFLNKGKKKFFPIYETRKVFNSHFFIRHLHIIYLSCYYDKLSRLKSSRKVKYHRKMIYLVVFRHFKYS